MPKQTTPKPKSKRTADLGEIAFERLLHAIESGELREGERVREVRIAEKWGIGITPVREAVRRVAALGYLILKPNHAPVVRKLSAEDVEQIFRVREALESLALNTCWEKITESNLKKLRKLANKAEAASGAARQKAQFHFDEELHRLWTSETNNPWLESSLERIVIYLPGLSRLLIGHREFVEITFNEHKLILNALEKRDRAKALKLLEEHIRNSGKMLVELSRDRQAKELPGV